MKTSNLFSEKGILMSAGYLHILQLAQQVLDAISDGDPDRLRTLSHRPVMRFGDAPTKTPWDDNLFLFQQLQTSMVLGLLLHHAYLLHLPGDLLYNIFDFRTRQIMHMKHGDEEWDILRGTAYELAVLVRDRYGLPEHPVIRQAIEYMRAHFADRPGAEDVARAVGLSAGRLNVLFKENTGQTLHDYQTTLRLQSARLLLANTQLPITQISTSLGFASASHFGKVFKSQTGLTPSQYRCRQKGLGIQNGSVPLAAAVPEKGK